MADAPKTKTDLNNKKVPFWKNRFLKLLFGLPIAMYFIYKLFYPTYTWHEKIAVTVSTPDGDKVGYAIRQIKFTFAPSLLSNASGFVRGQKGEAVVVDLGNDKYLFALLGGGGYAGSVYRKIFPDERAGQSSIKWYEFSLRGRGPIEIPRPVYPRLVHFEDVNDPVSVKKVNPERVSDSYGPGYQLKSITLEITSQSVTFGKIEEILSWINDLDGKMLDGASSSYISAKYKVANDLTLSDFIRD